MNADVNIDIDNLDLGSEILKPLRPLRAHLLLTDGILRIADIEAKTAQGELVGMVQLDGQKELALWELDLKWKNIKLEQWLNLTRSENQTPYVTGEVKGAAQLKGQGRSTARGGGGAARPPGFRRMPRHRWRLRILLPRGGGRPGRRGLHPPHLPRPLEHPGRA